MMARLLLLMPILLVSLPMSLSEDKGEFTYKLINKLREINNNSARIDATKCAIHVALYYEGVGALELWALNILDATAKLNSGILVGNVINMGDFDQCLNVEHDTGVSGLLKGQHCMVYSTVDLNNLPNITGMQSVLKSSHIDRRRQTIGNPFNMQWNNRENTPQTITFGFGICVPASCQGKELVEQLERILALVNITMDTDIEYDSERYCSSKEPERFSARDWIAIIIFGVIGILMVLSTMYELNLKFGLAEGHNPRNNIYLAFSVISNSKRIFAIHPNPPDNVRSDNIPCIHGIRVLSILWVVLGHRYTMTSIFPTINPLAMVDWLTQYHSSVIVGSTVSVDTFLVLSGVLLSYSFMKQRTKGIKMNVPMMYFHRYLRLTPPLAAVVLFHATLVSYIGSGPYWKQRPRNFHLPCNEYWWSALLYVQNYVNPGPTCVPQSWYLSVDMQVYILSPILLYALWHYPKPAIGAAVALILANIGIVFGVMYANEFGGGVETEEASNAIYVPTHTRYGPMIMGILLGYGLFKTLKVEVKLNQLLVFILWLCSFAVMLAVVFGAYPLNQIDHEKNVLEAAFYKSLHRIVWSLAICWIIFACTVGYGGLINGILSHPLWQPMSRLSYCLYLIHVTCQITVNGSRKYAAHFSDLDMVYQFWGDLGLSISVSVLWSLAFESPITIIEKVMFRKPQKADENTAVVKPDIANL